MKREKATLVHSVGEKRLVDWSQTVAADSRVIAVWNYNLLHDSLHLAQNYVDVEVVRVIFDQSLSAEAWLEFLSAMPAGFRGDVLFVVSPETAFISAVGRSDERVMYRLGEQDLAFYLKVSGLMMEGRQLSVASQPRESLCMVM